MSRQGSHLSLSLHEDLAIAGLAPAVYSTPMEQRVAQVDGRNFLG